MSLFYLLLPGPLSLGDGVLWAQEKHEWGWAGLGWGREALTAKGTGFPFGEMERLWNKVEVAAAPHVNVLNPPGLHALKWTQRHMLCYVYVTTITKKATGEKETLQGEEIKTTNSH